MRLMGRPLGKDGCRNISRQDGAVVAQYSAGKSIEGTVVQSKDTKSRWSLLSGVYARGSERSHTGDKCVTCSGLTSSREVQL